MLKNKEIKDIQSLSHKKFRTGLKLFVAEGPKIVSELAQIIPGQVERIYATREWIRTYPELLSSPVTEITEAELNRISQLSTPNQVVAVMRQSEQVEPRKDKPLLYLDTIQDPGNFGTIIRIADWFGLGGVVCSEGCADLYNLKVVQSTMASIGRVPVYYDINGTWLEEQNVPVYASVLKGTSIYELSPAKNGILLVGNESKGIRKELLDLATHSITIPRKGEAESLNAAVATGIIVSHLFV